MNARERRRLTEFSLVKQGRASVAEAARRLGICERQARRWWKRYREHGDKGLIHALRGRKSNFGDADLRRRVLAVYRQKYLGFNAAHAAEMLAQEKLPVARQTLWRWLRNEHLLASSRKVRKHRRRRTPRACVGEMIQMDGSTHAWFGPEHPHCVLFVMVDDASGAVFARFYATEDTAAAFDLFGRYVQRHGLPGSLYVDHDSIYVVNDEKAREKARQAGKKPPLTQFGRAMAELEVKIIAAHSPQAKGRVERMNRTLQDRLLKELSAAGICALEAANAFLEKQFLPRFNQRFARTPASGVNVHRRVPAGIKLAEVLCYKESRVVGQDWCVRFMGQILQIARRHEALKLAGKAIEVWQQPDATLQLRHRGQRLDFTTLVTRPERLPIRRTNAWREPWRPGADHPWKRGLPGRVAASVPFQSASLRSASFHSTDAASPPQESHAA